MYPIAWWRATRAREELGRFGAVDHVLQKLSTPLLEKYRSSALLRPDRHPPLPPPLDFA